MLSKSMADHGALLFRWRSYLPLVALPLFVAAVSQFSYPFGSHTLDVQREVFCVTLALTGLVLRGLTVGFAPRGTSGRNTKSMKAEALNTTGMYSLVRHPLYFANFIIFLAMMLDSGSWWLVCAGTLMYWIYYERIMLKEEAFLFERYGEAFTNWAQRTPAVVPRRHGWQSPAQPFCWKRVVRGEYSTLFMIVLVFTAIEVAGDLVVEHRLQLEPGWAIIFGAGLGIYLTVRVLKKATNVLTIDVAGGESEAGVPLETDAGRDR